MRRAGQGFSSSGRPGACTVHGGDPESAHFFHEVGLGYVSCSPFRIPVARLEAGRVPNPGGTTRGTVRCGPPRHDGAGAAACDAGAASPAPPDRRTAAPCSRPRGRVIRRRCGPVLDGGALGLVRPYFVARTASRMREATPTPHRLGDGAERHRPLGGGRVRTRPRLLPWSEDGRRVHLHTSDPDSLLSRLADEMGEAQLRIGGQVLGAASPFEAPPPVANPRVSRWERPYAGRVPPVEGTPRLPGGRGGERE
ncbi:hypothetical protein SUDANB6_04072 [Streptomyces sp. enrichment culture]